MCLFDENEVVALVKIEYPIGNGGTGFGLCGNCHDKLRRFFREDLDPNHVGI